MADFGRARDLLRGFKGEGYVHGMGVLWRAGASAAGVGRSAVLVRTSFPGGEAISERSVRHWRLPVWSSLTRSRDLHPMHRSRTCCA